MRIDIDGLSEAELIDLNNRVVERLKFLRHMRAHSQMLEFSIGDRVSFQPEGRSLQVGMLTRYTERANEIIGQRTATVAVAAEAVKGLRCAPMELRELKNSLLRP